MKREGELKWNLKRFAMRIIASAGDSKAVAFDALEAAKNNDFDKAAELLKESDKAGIDAHQAQTDLLVSEANGGKDRH